MRSFAEIDAVALLELGDDPVDDPLIEVVAAEMRVAVGRLHLDDAFAHLENRDVERAAAEVVDGDRLVLLLVEPVRQRRRRRLVDDAHHLEAGDLAGVLGRLPLRVVEVGRHGDDRLGDRLPEILLRGLLQLLQNHRGDFGRRIFLAVRADRGRRRSLARTTWYGTIFISSLTSSYLRPMKRLIEKTVFSGLVTAWRLATWPTSRSPVFVNATTDGVSRPPSGLVITTGSPPSMTATTELVVPRVDSDDFAH